MYCVDWSFDSHIRVIVVLFTLGSINVILIPLLELGPAFLSMCKEIDFF